MIRTGPCGEVTSLRWHFVFDFGLREAAHLSWQSYEPSLWFGYFLRTDLEGEVNSLAFIDFNEWLIEVPGRSTPCAHALASSNTLNFLRVQYSCNLFKTRTYRCTAVNGINEKNTRISRVQATTPSSEAAWTKTNKTCLWEKKATPAKGATLRESYDSTVKRVSGEQSRRGLKKQTRKQRSDSKLNGSEVPAEVSVKQPNKRLAGCWIKAKVMLGAMKIIKTTTTTQTATKVLLHNQQLREDVNKEEKGSNVRPLFTKSYQWI